MAQQGDLNAILDHAEELHAAGQYDAALVEARKLEAAIKNRFGTNNATYAIALATMARVPLSQGNYTEAEALFRRALSIDENALASMP